MSIHDQPKVRRKIHAETNVFLKRQYVMKTTSICQSFPPRLLSGPRAVCASLGIISSLLFSACTLPYGMYTDERDISTQVSDKSIATDIKTRLMGQKLSEGWAVSVYCFRGNVYLVGEIPEVQRDWAVNLAKRTDGVQNVVTHWFNGPSLDGDTLASVKLSANLIGAPNVNSTQIYSEVHAGEAVLLGIVSDQGVVNRAIRTAKNTPGIVKVTSYLLY